MFRKFLRDVRGNFAMLTGIAIVPILGGLALAIDYVDMSRQKYETLNALDAANMATARRILEGASDAEVRRYAREFFDANLGSVKPQDAELDIHLPANINGGGRVKLVARLKYDAQFLPPFMALLDRTRLIDDRPFVIETSSEVQLKNTVEVALVLDNSGSMDYYGSGSGQKRLALLKTAAKDLVDKLAATAQIMKQVEKPVQFALVPFAASVNVGPANASELWMDQKGISPIHHENFDWSTMPSNKKIERTATNQPYKKTGTGWPSNERNTIVNRFTLFDTMQRYYCTGRNCTATLQKYADWGGCVETRPFPYNTNDAKPEDAVPSTLYVPMFGPDEAGDDTKGFSANNSWWHDGTTSSEARTRQRYAAKYFTPLPSSPTVSGSGPNISCTTSAITPLTDVTVPAGVTKIKNAIDAMAASGNTNVPEGIAWGWRTLSSQAPFTGGRSETERGNDKVVIVLTDGANTYSSVNDSANNKSTYAAYGYAALNATTTITNGRIFSGTSNSVSKTSYTSSTYAKAMNEQFLKTCENINGGDTGGTGANIIVMTVALDLDSKNSDDSAQLGMLKKCASRSRYARDPDDLTKGKKLFWNATSTTLSQTFKEIADELANLRFVG